MIDYYNDKTKNTIPFHYKVQAAEADKWDKRSWTWNIYTYTCSVGKALDLW